MTRRTCRNRRAVSLAAASILFPAAVASAQLTTDIPVGSAAIGLEAVTDIGSAAIDLTHAGDGSDRYFIAAQSSTEVRIFDSGTLVTTPFIDMNATTGVTGAALAMPVTGERGLLGVAFHPNYAVAGQPGFGKFYTYTSENKGGNFAGVDYIHDELDGTDASPLNLGDHDSVIREWTVNPANANQILIDQTSTATRQASGRVVLRIRQPQSNHNGGAIKFGPDGMLYVAMGDGGGSNDQQTEPDGHTDATTTGTIRPSGNGQDVSDYEFARNENVLGKILRIDPRAPGTTPGAIGAASTNGQYRIPADNPRIGATDGADEVWAFGMRNPFRMSFDRGTGSLYVGDVGQGVREEIDIITKNGNYGWVYWEGTNLLSTPPGGVGSLGDIKPIGEYTHNRSSNGTLQGVAVIGGFVYRGQNIPELYGKYVFGELGHDRPETPEVVDIGRILYMDAAGGAISEFQYLLNAPSSALYSFGEDRDGELYAMFADGTVRRVLGRQWMNTTGGSWNTAGNWLGAVPNATGAAANFLGRVTAGGSAPATVTLDGSRTVGSMLFNNNVTNGVSPYSYRITAGTGGTLTLSNTGVAPVKVVKGAHEIAVPVTVAGNAEVEVFAAGSIAFTSTVSIGGTRTLTKKGAGAASMTGGVSMFSTSVLAVTEGILNVRNVTGGTINVSATGRLNVNADGGPTGTSKVVNVTATGGGKLDLSNNKLILTSGSVGTASGGTYDGLSGLIQSGRAGGAWNGAGVMTSQPDAATGLTAIGIATAAQTGRAGGTFSGQSVAGSDVLLMYTYGGDANLDGFVSGDDYTAIDFNIAIPGAAGWANGDFNYDGIISGDDYSMIDFNIVAQGTPFSTSDSVGDVVPVPEPAAAIAGVTVAMASMARRRRGAW